ncbi:hypothetical protein GE09DRAFT_1235611 [Coniochaeta sp. 2T2.1]|nr:hypothetical protein GE09DRAFT_1235611 [Coniochaeta sp. 2T2.1]
MSSNNSQNEGKGQEPDHYCAECDKPFSSALSLKRHLDESVTHGAQRSYFCAVGGCNMAVERFVRMDACTTHMRRQHGMVNAVPANAPIRDSVRNTTTTLDPAAASTAPTTFTGIFTTFSVSTPATMPTSSSTGPSRSAASMPPQDNSMTTDTHGAAVTPTSATDNDEVDTEEINGGLDTAVSANAQQELGRVTAENMLLNDRIAKQDEVIAQMGKEIDNLKWELARRDELDAEFRRIVDYEA